MILIEKSMWVPVAQIAIMKCGGTSTVLDASLTFQRHRSIARFAQGMISLFVSRWLLCRYSPLDTAPHTGQ